MPTYLAEKAQRYTRTEEFAEVLLRELPDRVEDVFLDDLGLSIRLSGVVWNDGRGEIGVVDRVMDRDGYLEAGVIVDWGTGDTSPHRLWVARCGDEGCEGTEEEGEVQTVRLEYAVMLGRFESTTEESLRRTASEGFDSNCWGGAIGGSGREERKRERWEII